MGKLISGIFALLLVSVSVRAQVVSCQSTEQFAGGWIMYAEIKADLAKETYSFSNNASDNLGGGWPPWLQFDGKVVQDPATGTLVFYGQDGAVVGQLYKKRGRNDFNGDILGYSFLRCRIDQNMETK